MNENIKRLYASVGGKALGGISEEQFGLNLQNENYRRNIYNGLKQWKEKEGFTISWEDFSEAMHVAMPALTTEQNYFIPSYVPQENNVKPVLTGDGIKFDSRGETQLTVGKYQQKSPEQTQFKFNNDSIVESQQEPTVFETDNKYQKWGSVFDFDYIEPELPEKAKSNPLTHSILNIPYGIRIKLQNEKERLLKAFEEFEKNPDSMRDRNDDYSKQTLVPLLFQALDKPGFFEDIATRIGSYWGSGPNGVRPDYSDSSRIYRDSRELKQREDRMKDFLLNTPQGRTANEEYQKKIGAYKERLDELEQSNEEKYKAYIKKKYGIDYQRGPLFDAYLSRGALPFSSDKEIKLMQRKAKLIYQTQKKYKSILDVYTYGGFRQFWTEVWRNLPETIEDTFSLGLIPLEETIQLKQIADNAEINLDELSPGDREFLDVYIETREMEDAFKATRTTEQEVGRQAPEILSTIFLSKISKLMKLGKAGELTSKILKPINKISPKVAKSIGMLRTSKIAVPIKSGIEKGLKTFIHPDSWNEAIKNMEGDYGYEIDPKTQQIKFTKTGKMSFPEAFGQIILERSIDGLASGIAKYAGKSLNKGYHKYLSPTQLGQFLSSKKEYLDGFKEISDALGLGDALAEMFEKQISVILHSTFGTGKYNWSDLVNGDQQTLDFLTAISVNLGVAAGDNLTKGIITKDYQEALSEFNKNFIETSLSSIAFKDALGKGSVEDATTMLFYILNEDLTDKQKEAAATLFSYSMAFNAMQGAKDQKTSSESATIPKRENGKADFNELIKANPEEFVTIWEKRYGPDKTKERLQQELDRVTAAINAEEAKLENETDLNVIYDIGDDIEALDAHRQVIETIMRKWHVTDETLRKKINKVNVKPQALTKDDDIARQNDVAPTEITIPKISLDDFEGDVLALNEENLKRNVSKKETTENAQTYGKDITQKLAELEKSKPTSKEQERVPHNLAFLGKKTTEYGNWLKDQLKREDPHIMNTLAKTPEYQLYQITDEILKNNPGDKALDYLVKEWKKIER